VAAQDIAAAHDFVFTAPAVLLLVDEGKVSPEGAVPNTYLTPLPRG
jgi:CubicO group peptidase (beta-lactamase class C family)